MQPPKIQYTTSSCLLSLDMTKILKTLSFFSLYIIDSHFSFSFTIHSNYTIQAFMDNFKTHHLVFPLASLFTWFPCNHLDQPPDAWTFGEHHFLNVANLNFYINRPLQPHFHSSLMQIYYTLFHTCLLILKSKIEVKED